MNAREERKNYLRQFGRLTHNKDGDKVVVLYKTPRQKSPWCMSSLDALELYNGTSTDVYPIPLEDLAEKTCVVDWVLHLCIKSWVKPGHIQLFTESALDHLGFSFIEYGPPAGPDGKSLDYIERGQMELTTLPL